MADILEGLLQAYKSDALAQRTASLTWLDGVYIIPSLEQLPSDWSAVLPCLLIYGNMEKSKPAYLPYQCADIKAYRVMLTILADGTNDPVMTFVGDAYLTGISQMASDLETLYRRKTFDLSDTVFLQSRDYIPRRIPPMDGWQNIIQAHLTFVHDYMDMRGL